MPQRLSGIKVEYDVVGGNPLTGQRPARVNQRVTEQPNQPPQLGDEPIAWSRPARQIFTPAELDRFYRRLHPIRHSVARRQRRMQREREIEAMVDEERMVLRQRESLMRHVGSPNTNEQLRQRFFDRDTDLDAFAEFSRRRERLFREAMEREVNELAEQFGRMRISDPAPTVPGAEDED